LPRPESRTSDSTRCWQSASSSAVGSPLSRATTSSPTRSICSWPCMCPPRAVTVVGPAAACEQAHENFFTPHAQRRHDRCLAMPVDIPCARDQTGCDEETLERRLPPVSPHEYVTRSSARPYGRTVLGAQRRRQ